MKKIEHPKVFVSHASEDKERFVADFAKRLRESGIDAWYDDWEIQAGDSLVQKIFVQGIAEADAFVIVLSENSVEKPWVIEELDSAVVRKISDDCRIIPVVLDHCNVPQPLKHLRWETIADLGNWDSEFQKILNVLCGSTDKPPLGEVPPMAAAQVIDFVPELSKADNMVFAVFGERYLSCGKIGIDVQKEFSVFDSVGLSREEVLESLEMLGSESYLKTYHGFNPSTGKHEVVLARVRWSALERFARRKFPNYDQLFRDLVSAITNNGAESRDAIVTLVSMPENLLEIMVHDLDSRGLIHVVYESNGLFHCLRPKSPQLKRMLG
ncbi:MAG: toll/interleukin-1 receptor domain-containing protein [Verrucomicrobiales bacterium]|nr:toll/interleukin-1 receptor domain-containing protein [Verrucomicrobiales bacterium]